MKIFINNKKIYKKFELSLSNNYLREAQLSLYFKSDNKKNIYNRYLNP
ncbi:MAG: hypothetical protein KAI43_04100 [Candidatus Aureabacteria bacterium]|nr:hypothetical protein [Candidatus Auribacterota bacterium]